MAFPPPRAHMKAAPLPDNPLAGYSSDDGETIGGCDDDDGLSCFSSETDSSLRESVVSLDNSVPRRPFRVDRRASPMKPVYEAWIINQTPSTQELTGTLHFLGIPMIKHIENTEGTAECRPAEYTQAELVEWHMKALDGYAAAKSPRRLPLFRRRKRLSYDDELDARVRKWSSPMQEELHNLLAAREAATSSPWRSRDWSVVVVAEHLQRSFAATRPEPVRPHHKKKGFPTEFLCIIRGAEARVSDDKLGFRDYFRDTNPWKHFDDAEHREKNRAWRPMGPPPPPPAAAPYAFPGAGMRPPVLGPFPGPGVPSNAPFLNRQPLSPPMGLPPMPPAPLAGMSAPPSLPRMSWPGRPGVNYAPAYSTRGMPPPPPPPLPLPLPYAVPQPPGYSTNPFFAVPPPPPPPPQQQPQPAAFPHSMLNYPPPVVKGKPQWCVQIPPPPPPPPPPAAFPHAMRNRASMVKGTPQGCMPVPGFGPVDVLTELAVVKETQGVSKVGVDTVKSEGGEKPEEKRQVEKKG